MEGLKTVDSPPGVRDLLEQEVQRRQSAAGGVDADRDEILLFSLGMLYCHLGSEEKALQMAQILQPVNPDNAKTLETLAKLGPMGTKLLLRQAKQGG